MRERLIELKRKFVENFDCGECYPENEKCRKCLTEKEADYLLANGVIIPPCKVGDTVWEIYEGAIFEETIRGVMYEVFDGKNIFAYATKTVFSGNRHYVCGVFEECDIGNTVFLTKEEAENALKERERE